MRRRARLVEPRIASSAPGNPQTTAWATLGAVCLAASVAGAQASPQPLPAGDPEVLDAVLIDHTVIALDRDPTIVRAFDVVTRREIWHVTFETAASGRHSLHRLAADRVLVLGGSLRVVLDLATGRELARFTDPSGRDASFDARHGACLIRRGCSVDVVSCDDTHTLVPNLHGRTISRIRYDRSGSDSGCWGFDVTPVGRAGDRIVIAAIQLLEGNDTRSVVRAYDASTGALRWSTPMRATLSSPSDLAGVAHDGTYAWVVDFSGALALWDTASGRVRFARRGGTGNTVLGAAGSMDGPPGSFFLQANGRATLYDARTGRARWTTQTPDAISFPAGLHVSEGVLDVPARAVAVLDPGDGRERSRIAISVTTHLTPTADGGVEALGSPAGWTSSGAPRVVASAPSIRVRREHDVATIVRSSDGTAIERFGHDAWPVGSYGDGTRTYNAVLLAPAGAARRLHVVETPSWR